MPMVLVGFSQPTSLNSLADSGVCLRYNANCSVAWKMVFAMPAPALVAVRTLLEVERLGLSQQSQAGEESFDGGRFAHDDGTFVVAKQFNLVCHLRPIALFASASVGSDAMLGS